MRNNIAPSTVEKRINLKKNLTFLNDEFWIKNRKDIYRHFKQTDSIKRIQNIGCFIEKYHSPPILTQEIMVTVHMDYNKLEKLHLYSINDILDRI